MEEKVDKAEASGWPALLVTIEEEFFRLDNQRGHRRHRGNPQKRITTEVTENTEENPQKRITTEVTGGHRGKQRSQGTQRKDR
jgi:hypothetical protein